MSDKYRTADDIGKELAKCYNQLGKLLWELERMIKKENEKRIKRTIRI